MRLEVTPHYPSGYLLYLTYLAFTEVKEKQNSTHHHLSELTV